MKRPLDAAAIVALAACIASSRLPVASGFSSAEALAKAVSRTPASYVVSGFSRTTAGAQSGADLFRQALSKERAEGQLADAIRVYERIAKEFAADRPLVAKALLQLARCYEKLGRQDARATYERILREYPDQSQPAADARAWLAVNDVPNPPRTVVTMRAAWAERGNIDLGWMSRDGRIASFTDWDTGDLAIRDLAAGTSRRLTAKGSWVDSPEHTEDSVISPDGSRVAYSWANRDGFYELRLISVKGGRPRVLYRNAEVAFVKPLEWSPDGAALLALFSRQDKTNQLVFVSAADGSTRVLKSFDWRAPWNAVFSPDGRYVAYDFPPDEDAAERDLFLIAADGSRETPLVAHRAQDFLLGWIPGSDRVLFASDRSGATGAWTIRVENGRPRGDPELVKPNIGYVLPGNFTRTGDYYYPVSTGRRDIDVARRDPESGRLPEALAPMKGRPEDGKLAGAWSPDGAQIAYLQQSPLVKGGEGANTLAIQTLDTGRVQTLPLKMSYATRLRWLPDGRALIVGGTDLKGRRGLFRVELSTAALSPIVYGSITRCGIDPDGRRVIYVRGTSIVARDLQTGDEREIHRLSSQTGAGDPGGANAGLAVSPDGRWLAVKVNRASNVGRPSIEIIPAAGGEPRTLVTLADVDASTWREMAWSPDGRFVLFTKGNSQLWQVPAAGGPAEKLADNLLYINSISVHPNGRQIAVSEGSAKYEIWVMQNLLPAVTQRSSPSAARR